MSILRHEEIDPDLRDQYLRRAAERRRQIGDETEANGTNEASTEVEETDTERRNPQSSEEIANAPMLTDEQFADLANREQFRAERDRTRFWGSQLGL